jgi:hypothetical protein
MVWEIVLVSNILLDIGGAKVGFILSEVLTLASQAIQLLS